MSPLRLLFDTSTQKGFVALAEGCKILWYASLPVGNAQAHHLFPLLEEGLKQCGGVERLEAVSVGIGPGSFTGIRIGVAAAKGLACARNLPLFGFPSLRSFVSQKEGRFLSVIDARRERVFALLQERQGGEVRPLEEPHLLSFAQVELLRAECVEVVSPTEGLPFATAVDPDAYQAVILLEEQRARKEGVFHGELPLCYLAETYVSS